MAEGGGSPPSIIPLSPPQAEVDESPLQKQMDRNKECEYPLPPPDTHTQSFVPLGVAVCLTEITALGSSVAPQIAVASLVERQESKAAAGNTCILRRAHKSPQGCWR